jgi:hypothetical protein
MFVHTVFFWLANPESQSDQDALRAGLESLKGINDISVAYVGKPADTRRPVVDHTYDFSLTLVFADRAAHDAYQVHPCIWSLWPSAPTCGTGYRYMMRSARCDWPDAVG